MTADLVMPHGLYDIVGFHCQQEAEKLLKGVLVATGQAPPRTHDLSILVLALESCGVSLPAVDDAAMRLTPLAAMSRYPGFGELTAADARDAIGAATRIRTACEAALVDS